MSVQNIYNWLKCWYSQKSIFSKQMSEIQNLPENASKNAENIFIYAVCT